MTNINFAACFLFLLLLLLSSISKWISIFSSSEGYEYPWWRGMGKIVEWKRTERKIRRQRIACKSTHIFHVASLLLFSLPYQRARTSGREFENSIGSKKKLGNREQLHSMVINLFNKEQTLLLPSIRQQAAKHDEWKTRKSCCGVWAGGKRERWKWARNCSTFQLSLNQTEKGGKLIFGGIKISANLKLELDCKKARLGALKVFN